MSKSHIGAIHLDLPPKPIPAKTDKRGTNMSHYPTYATIDDAKTAWGNSGYLNWDWSNTPFHDWDEELWAFAIREEMSWEDDEETLDDIVKKILLAEGEDLADYDLDR